MAKVMYARLCRKIKRNKQTGLYTLLGSFATLREAKAPLCFVLVVYWLAANERFQQSFAITDPDGKLLDHTPRTECVLEDRQVNISTAFFYRAFPRAGQYSINVYQNGVCTEAIPLHVLNAQQTGESHWPFLAPFNSATT